MKARFTDNSIRLRLRKSDISTLKEKGKVVMKLAFTPQPFYFTLQLDPQEHTIRANRYGDSIVVMVPEELGREWINTDRVGLKVQDRKENGHTLDILVEKDFPCAHRPMEDKSDTFHELG